MQRKVKAYLSAMPIIDSENELDRLSIECEPQPQSAPSNGSVPSRRRMPSPSPSSISSHSNQSDQKPPRFHVPKFGIYVHNFASKFTFMQISGVESPQAVQKMLNLVQNSKLKSVPTSKQNSYSPVESPLISTISSSRGNSSIKSNSSTPQVVRRIPSFSSTRGNPAYTTELSIDSAASNEDAGNLKFLKMKRERMIYIYILGFHLKRNSTSSIEKRVD